MLSDWNESLAFGALADLAQTADFRNDTQSLQAIPPALLRRALDTCGTAGNGEAAHAYRFVMNVVRGLQRAEPKSALWLVEVMNTAREHNPELAWDAAIELLRLLQPQLRSRMQQSLIGADALKENPLAVVEACYYPLEVSLDDVLVGALIHSAYRTVFLREKARHVAAVFAATRELYGYVRAREKPTAIRCLDWCQTQTELVTQLAADVRDLLAESLVAASFEAADLNDDLFGQQILALGLLWAPRSGNARATVCKELGLAYKRLGELDKALRTLDAGVRIAEVDDDELKEELQAELSMLRAELENAPEQIQIPKAPLAGYDGAEEVLQALQAVLVRKSRGDRVMDEEYIEVIAKMHTWNQRAAKLQIKAPTRLNQALLLLGAAMSMQDRRRCPVPLPQLLSEAEALRPAADVKQLLRLNMMRKELLGN